MDKELLGAMVPMMGFKKEIYEYVEELVSKRLIRKKDCLLTIEEASKILNVKVSRLRQAIFRKEISYIKLGALVRFREEDLNNFIQKNLKSLKQS